MKISVAVPNELEAIVPLLTAQLQEHEIYTPIGALREAVQAVLGDARHGFILLARENNEAVGVAYAACHLSAEHGGFVGWLEELYLRPEYRGRRIGSALLKATMARAQELNWRALELEVVVGHERAAALYLRHGFASLPRTRYTRLLRP
ncbi:MAG TPA: GNAT family N-acetyltransferase [Chthoniobacterales bacterium]